MLVKLTCSLSSRGTVFLIRVILMSFKMIFQLIGMHGLDVTCLPDLLIFVLSLKLNYFGYFLKKLRRILCCITEKCLWNTLRSLRVFSLSRKMHVQRSWCGMVHRPYHTYVEEFLIGTLEYVFRVHLQNLWELFISEMCGYLILRNVQASVYCSKS